jgi:hypothetical protein
VLRLDHSVVEHAVTDLAKVAPLQRASFRENRGATLGASEISGPSV